MMNDDVLTIVFKGEYYGDVLFGVKTSTCRMLPLSASWEHVPVVGECVDLRFDCTPTWKYVPAIITSTRVVAMRDIDDEIATNDGFASADELRERLMTTYASRGITIDTLMLVVEFDVIR